MIRFASRTSTYLMKSSGHSIYGVSFYVFLTRWGNGGGRPRIRLCILSGGKWLIIRNSTLHIGRFACGYHLGGVMRIHGGFNRGCWHRVRGGVGSRSFSRTNHSPLHGITISLQIVREISSLYNPHRLRRHLGSERRAWGTVIIGWLSSPHGITV